MRSEVEHHLLMSTAKNPRIGERRQTGANLDGTTSSIVQDTIVVRPPIDVPDPTGEGAVDESSPEENEDHGREHATTFCHRTNDESGCHTAEHHLEKSKSAPRLLASGPLTLRQSDHLTG